MFKKPTYKRFDYQPRYYKPELDEEEKRKRRLGFRSNFRNKVQKKIPIHFIIMLLIILFLLLKYNGII